MSAAAGRRVFVTGGAGPVGRALVATLAARGHAVRSLSRAGGSDAGVDPAASWETGVVSVVTGDLRAPEAWRGALEDCDVVVHLAARTGKAAPADYAADNVEGSRRLLEACRDAEVGRFLFVSSIAARFPPRPDYPYARSKAAAEALVAASGLRFTTVRPTIVAGPGSGSLAGLVKLAGLPVIPLLGGGTTPVQPIWVGDLAFLLRRIVDRDRFDGETLELGGPEVLAIGDLLRQIRRLRGGSDRAVGLPAAPVLALLVAAEKLARPLLPVTAGQLASFVHDGTIEVNTLFSEARPELLTVDQMLRASGVGRGGEGARRVSTAVAAGGEPSVPSGQSADRRRALEEECRVFCAYLLAAAPTAYLLGRYVAAHQALADLEPVGSFDGALLELAVEAPAATRLADAYARVFAPRGLLRRKLSLLLAIAESAPELHRLVDAVDPVGRPRLVARLTAEIGLWFVALAAGTALLLPVHGLARLRDSGRPHVAADTPRPSSREGG